MQFSETDFSFLLFHPLMEALKPQVSISDSDSDILAIKCTFQGKYHPLHGTGKYFILRGQSCSMMTASASPEFPQYYAFSRYQVPLQNGSCSPPGRFQL